MHPSLMPANARGKPTGSPARAKVVPPDCPKAAIFSGTERVMGTTVKIDTDNGLIALTNSKVQELLGYLDLLHAAVPLSLFTFKLNGAGPEYKYELTAADGRKWTQLMTFDTPQNPLMTFDVPVAWRLSEFRGQRELRDVVVYLKSTLGVTNIRVEW